MKSNTRKHANCKVCNKRFEYYPKQEAGLYCSNKCRGEHEIICSFTENTVLNSARKRYIVEKILTDHRCSICSQGRVWNNKPLILQIDHINGNNKDNRINNLRLVCPNCHTQTETWGNPKKESSFWGGSLIG